MANGSLTSTQSGEGMIRENLVRDDLVDCIVALPAQLFYTTGIPVCLWFLDRNKASSGERDRRGETLFIDARQIGSKISRTQIELSDDEIAAHRRDVPRVARASGRRRIRRRPWVLRERDPRCDRAGRLQPLPGSLRRRARAEEDEIAFAGAYGELVETGSRTRWPRTTGSPMWSRTPSLGWAMRSELASGAAW